MTVDQNVKATTLRELYLAPDLLQVVNIWDAVSARAVANVPGTTAIATAGHSMAATFGYPDGEIPLETTLDLIERIAAETDLPITADLDDAYGKPGDTTRRAIGAGAVGANVEDRLKPLVDAVETVEAIIAAGQKEGVDFVLNARTDAFVRGGDRPVAESVADAIERGRAFLDAGATCVFVPGNFGESVVAELVAGIGEYRVSLIGLPEIPSPAKLTALKVARLSYGPLVQRIALGAVVDFAAAVYAGEKPPEGIRPLN